MNVYNKQCWKCREYCRLSQMIRYENARTTAAADSKYSPIVPVARYSACDIAWHVCVQQTVLEVLGAVPVVTGYTRVWLSLTRMLLYPSTLPMVPLCPKVVFVVVSVETHACCPHDHPRRARRHLPSFPCSKSLRAPSPTRRDGSHALWRSFRQSAARPPARSLSICSNPLSGNIIPGSVFMFKSKRSLSWRTRLVISQK